MYKATIIPLTLIILINYQRTQSPDELNTSGLKRLHGRAFTYQWGTRDTRALTGESQKFDKFAYYDTFEVLQCILK